MTDERKKQLMEQVGFPDSHSIKALIEQVENETMQTKPEVSELYLQQVNTAQLVLHLRGAVEAALKNGMQFATAVGTLHLMIREVGDWAITEMESANE